MKIALCLIIKPTDKEADLLDRCLGGVVDGTKQLLPHQRSIDMTGTDGLAKYVDSIYITITGKNDRCEEVAKKYNAHISNFTWIGNFSAARTFNFSQISNDHDYIIWCDTDDVWRHPGGIRRLVGLMKERAVDVINLPYFYHFNDEGKCDTKHYKTRIIKNDGCLEWNGARVHEDFSPTRRVNIMANDEVEVLHLTDDERIDDSKKRNTDIARAELEEKPDDPRSYWNLANALFTEGKHIETIPLYLEFLDKSNAEEERTLAWVRLGRAYAIAGDLSRGIGCVLESISLRPWYPDGYLTLGEIYLRMGKPKHAVEMLEMGMSKPIPDREIIAYNPIDYTLTPHVHLAEAFVRMHRPDKALKHLKKANKMSPKNERVKELIKIIKPELKKYKIVGQIFEKAKKAKSKDEIRKLLDATPEDMIYHPGIIALRNAHFVKTESSGKDVVFYCGYTGTEWSPEVFKTKGVGGSEEAVIQLVKRWKDAGYNVSVYANVGYKELEFDGVKWIPWMAWNPRDKQDVTILWRFTAELDKDINSDKIYADIHDVVTHAEFTPDRLKKLDKVLFKSEVHRKYYDKIPDDKCLVIPHGLDIERFEDRRKVVVKNPYKILNTSSPDRGLLTSLNILEKVYDKLPDKLKPKLKFRWNYGFRVWDIQFADNQEMMDWKAYVVNKLESLKDLGIVEEESGDMISQEAIVDQYLESGLLLYPSEFFEIGFISGTKAALAGAIPVTTDVFAQGEFLKDGIIVHSETTYDNWMDNVQKTGSDFGVQKPEQVEEFVDKIVEYMKNPGKYEAQRNKLIEYARANFDWNKTATAWTEIF